MNPDNLKDLLDTLKRIADALEKIAREGINTREAIR